MEAALGARAGDGPIAVLRDTVPFGDASEGLLQRVAKADQVYVDVGIRLLELSGSFGQPLFEARRFLLAPPPECNRHRLSGRRDLGRR